MAEPSSFVPSDRAAEEGWELALIRPAGQALSIFQISGAEEHLPFIDDVGRSRT
jgi:hypothetical protein